MKSTLGIWHDVKTGKLDPQKAFKLLDRLPGGGNDTRTFRRIKKFVAQKQQPVGDGRESTSVRIVAAGNTCVRCKINAAPMPCWLGTAVAVPFVLDAGHKALEAAREALRATGPAILCSYDESSGGSV